MRALKSLKFSLMNNFLFLTIHYRIKLINVNNYFLLDPYGAYSQVPRANERQFGIDLATVSHSKIKNVYSLFLPSKMEAEELY